MAEPGRHCPLAYRSDVNEIATAPAHAAETLYIVGGLYGNRFALDAVVRMAEQERAMGLPRPLLVFNGDFNWFNAERESLRHVNEAVLSHLAIPGNVELELADPTMDAGCGCAYPDWVTQGVVERSNQIMRRLQDVTAPQTDIQRRLRALPRHLRVTVGNLRVGVLHGDPDAVAGWGLSIENAPEPGSVPAGMRRWFDDARVDVLACTHTCVAYMQDFPLPSADGLVMNNGAAGMPNFRGDLRGLVSRISVAPALSASVVGRILAGVHCDLMPITWDQGDWRSWFTRLWPPGSPAYQSYMARLTDGPDHNQQDANRLMVGARDNSRHGDAVTMLS